ncbi:MAG: glycine--tRNA ligase subunit beta, partial [Endomicrobiales bacterium]
MVKNALLEIGTEEIPSSYLEPARRQMAVLAEQLFKARRLGYEKIAVYATPRRLTLFVEKLEEKSEDRVEEVTGPAARAGRDEQGNFTMAAKGFAARHGVPAEKLVIKATEKGEYLCVSKKIPGEKTEKVLPGIFPEIIKKLYFPKTMVWEASHFRFARPVRSFVALYGERVIRFSLAGVKSANWTIGLHVLSMKKIAINLPERYLTLLRNNCVIADQDERREILDRIIESTAKRAKGSVLKDEALVEEVNYLVEHPVAVLSRFDEKYLQLPPEILVTCLRKKQKCFAMQDASGRLQNHFIGIRNGISEHQDVVREGYERVLEARLADAGFFFHKDTRTPLAGKFEKLKGVVFQQKLGTVHDKVLRVQALAAFLNESLGGRVEPSTLETAARLMKADLVTEMVFEYPELQGIVGRIYAGHDGEGQEVARSVEEHYWPLSAEGKLPEGDLATMLSLADKLDTLAGDFAVGLVPTGSADPYGLRRMATAVVRLLLEKQLPLRLRPLVEKAFSLLPEHFRGEGAAQGQVLDFLRQRLENLLEAAGYRFDEVRAVLATGFDEVTDAKARLDALKKIRGEKDFEPLAVAFKRALNILKQAEKNKIAVPQAVSAELLKEEQEKDLYAGVQKMEADIAVLLEKREYTAALQKMVGLKGAVDGFFDKVMVMAEDAALRANRLAI